MDGDGTIGPKLNPEMARVYRDYLLTCRRLGIAPLPRERAAELIREWPRRSRRKVTPA